MGRQKLDTSIMTEMGDVVDLAMEADINYVTLPKEIMAWEIDYNQQAEDEVSKKLIQTISFRHKKPIKVFRGIPSVQDKSTDTIAEEKFDEALAMYQNYQQKKSLLLWFAIIAVALLLIISIVVLISL
jgi:hypothetical protein